jgi:hypothetical protein
MPRTAYYPRRPKVVAPGAPSRVTSALNARAGACRPCSAPAQDPTPAPPPMRTAKSRFAAHTATGPAPLQSEGPPPPAWAHRAVCEIGLEFSKNYGKGGPPALAGTIGPVGATNGSAARSIGSAGLMVAWPAMNAPSSPTSADAARMRCR